MSEERSDNAERLVRLVDPQPPQRNYGVDVIVYPEETMCVYSPFKNRVASWSVESYVSQTPMDVVLINKLWWWVILNESA